MLKVGRVGVLVKMLKHLRERNAPTTAIVYVRRKVRWWKGTSSAMVRLVFWWATYELHVLNEPYESFSIHASRPVCPAWSSWKIDTPCSVTCGQGYSSKYRTCINGQIGEEGCQGNARSQEVCETGNECPVWAEWGEWSECGVTCGQSQVVRRRQCLNGEPGDIGCEGDDAETKVCFGPNRECPSWSPWSNLSPCSVSRLSWCNYGSVCLLWILNLGHMWCWQCHSYPCM